MSGKQTDYVVITPVRDEAEHIGATIESVVAQTVQPRQWIIVDDGSTDGTLDIIQQHAARIAWIVPVSRQNRGFRNTNTGAVEAFFEGYSRLTSTSWDFLVNLDGDLGLEPKYFERCLKEFQKDPVLGIAGGMLYHMKDGIKTMETAPLFHVRGATKIYRRECWDAIGGIPRTSGWDTLDELKANMLGWRTRSFPDVLALHRKSTGASEGALRDAIKNGRSEYFCGYHPLFMLAKCIRRTFHRPYFLAAGALGYGFLACYFTRSPRVNDTRLIRYIRNQQLKKLLLLETVWK
jgi:biofilm PGA synthesis N-glycosyltransferase PgaC